MRGAALLQVTGVGVILSVVLQSAGCPVPLPSGYGPGSRENIGSEVPSQLVVGVSTREDVLLLLGEPDSAAGDDSWLAYGSVYGRGGVVFVVFAGGSAAGAGGEEMEYRRLVFRFDPSGSMSGAEFVEKACWENIMGMGSAGVRTPPCLESNAPN